MQERKAVRKANETIRDVGESARESVGRAQETTSRAAEGFRDYQLKVVAAAQANGGEAGTVRQHWESIAAGNIPFGLSVERA